MFSEDDSNIKIAMLEEIMNTKKGQQYQSNDHEEENIWSIGKTFK